MTIKAGVALAGAGLLLWPQLARRDRSDRHDRLRGSLLVGLAMFAAFCWWNLLAFHFGAYVHVWETYHYYVGSKYFRELDYARLYECAAVADAESGLLAQVRARPIRHLETNLIGTTATILADPGRCTRHFSAERWRAFKADLAWFRERLGPRRWVEAQLDHGYNATPAWGLTGALLASTGPASTTQVLALTLLDPALLLAMWAVAWWAFGWEATCVALIYWGTNYPARFYWTGGAYLRQDWLALTVAGIALLRRDYPGLAGFSLMWAALLRVFPGLVLVAIMLQALAGIWQARRLHLGRSHRRLAAGAVLAIALLVPLASQVAGGFGAWPAFLTNSLKHAATPLTNHVGLRTLVAYDHDTRARLSAPLGLESDPFQVWKEARRRTFAERWPIFAVLVAGFAALLVWAVRHQEPWVAAVLGVGLIPVTTELTAYYYAVLLAFGFLWLRREVVGVGLCLLAAATCLIPKLTGWDDEVHTLISGVVIAFVVAATILIGRLRSDPQVQAGGLAS